MGRAGRKGLTCILWVLVIFLVTYMGLVFTYRVDGYAVMIVGVIFGVLGMLLFVASAKTGGNRTRNYCGIFSGIFLWAAVGEVAEHMGMFDLASWQMWPLLGVTIFVTLVLSLGHYIPVGMRFAMATFAAIWGLHFVMINEYEFMGRTSWITYPSCAIFLLLAIVFGYRMTRTRREDENMGYALALLLTAWTVLEYLWGWRIVPGPWMLK